MLEVRPFSIRDRLFLSFADRFQPRHPELFEQAATILHCIRTGGSQALVEQEKISGWSNLTMDTVRISESEIAAARDHVPEAFLTALSLARVNMRKFHEYQRRRGYVHDDGDNVRLARRTRPLSRIGIVNAGSCSSLLSCAVPAQVAGVGSIALALAPDADGQPNKYILAAAKVLGIEELYRLSDAQAIAAFTYGTIPVNRVDRIIGATGPMAQTALQLVRGQVGVDTMYNADELAIIADSSANAKFIAIDFLAQAESGENSLAVLFTTDRLLAEAVRIEMDRLADSLPDPARIREIAAKRCGLFVCPSLSVALDAANRLAPSRLGLQTRDDEILLPDVDTAGTVYMGALTCQAVADCFSGANALLPGWGQTRWASGPAVEDFVQEMNVVEYSQDRLIATGRHCMELALADNRPGRAESVRERLELLRLAHE